MSLPYYSIVLYLLLHGFSNLAYIVCGPSPISCHVHVTGHIVVMLCRLVSEIAQVELTTHIMLTPNTY